jgi:hypothetical protein
VDPLSFLASTVGSAAAAGFAVGAVALSAAAAAKGYLDQRSMAALASDVPSRSQMRRDARDQIRELDQARVSSGVPTGGQFSARNRVDSDVQL